MNPTQPFRNKVEHWSPGARFRFKAFSEVFQADVLYLAIWHQTASAQTVDCIHNHVTLVYLANVGREPSLHRRACQIMPMQPRIRG